MEISREEAILAAQVLQAAEIDPPNAVFIRRINATRNRFVSPGGDGRRMGRRCRGGKAARRQSADAPYRAGGAARTK